MNLSIALGLGARSVVGGVVSPPPLAPEFRDDFNTDGNLNGRTGWAVETRPTFSGQVNTITATSGSAGGTAGSAAFALHNAAVEDVRVNVTLGNLGGLYHFANIAAVDAERDFINIGFSQAPSAGLLSGNISINRTLNGSSGTLSFIPGARAEIGDSYESAITTVEGVKFMQPFLNGRAQFTPTNTFNVAGLDYTIKKHGLIGNTGARTFDDFQVADPATQQVLRLYQPNRTVALNTDGSVTWRLTVEYTQDDPTTLLASVFDTSVSRVTPIAALTRVALSNFTASAGSAYGELTATAAQIASGGPFFIQVIDPNCRDAEGNTVDSVSKGPYQTSGYVIGTAGQSLAVSMSSQAITTDTYTPPANTWWIDGAPTSAGVLGDNSSRKQFPLTSNTSAAAIATGFAAAASNARSTVIRGGVGGTAIASRTVGTFSHTALLDALNHAGGRFHLLQWMDGQSDLATAPATYTATLETIANDIASRNGGSVRILMHPISSGWGTAASNDEAWQTVRRTQWALTQTNPSRYTLGAYSMDVQKTDNLHPTNNGYGELGRRCGVAAAAALGLASDAGRGPSLFSVERIDAQTVYCVYDLEGADSISLLNTAYASEFHGGMLFSTSSANNGSTITTKLFPTGATVDASPVAGKQGITFTFATGSFPSAVFAWAAYGKNPFNPNDNGTNTDPVNLDFAGKASMIVGVRAGEPNVALQPRFATDGTDWLTDV